MTQRDWDIRAYVYRFFVEYGCPPTVENVAQRYHMSKDAARAAYRRLHDGHMFFLRPGTDEILIANPLSAIETHFKVYVSGKKLNAACAWDSLGIPAMLGKDASIEACYADSGQKVNYRIHKGQVEGKGGYVHFALPFREWYDDLIHT